MGEKDRMPVLRIIMIGVVDGQAGASIKRNGFAQAAVHVEPQPVQEIDIFEIAPFAGRHARGTQLRVQGQGFINPEPVAQAETEIIGSIIVAGIEPCQ